LSKTHKKHAARLGGPTLNLFKDFEESKYEGKENFPEKWESILRSRNLSYLSRFISPPLNTVSCPSLSL
jgi:hypothetical protein